MFVQYWEREYSYKILQWQVNVENEEKFLFTPYFFALISIGLKYLRLRLLRLLRCGHGCRQKFQPQIGVLEIRCKITWEIGALCVWGEYLLDKTLSEGLAIWQAPDNCFFELKVFPTFFLPKVLGFWYPFRVPFLRNFCHWIFFEILVEICLENEISGVPFLRGTLTA